MPALTHHIFVCCNCRSEEHPRGCCDSDGSEQLRHAFKAEVRNRNLTASVRANKCGCLDQCELGPVVVVYPQAIWYGKVQVDDVARILDTTIQRGEVVEDLLIADEWLNTKGRGPRQDGEPTA
jgi:(2Fe-2S) ferredoxin